MGGAVSFATGAAAGFRLPFEAIAMLRRERSLWALAAVPSALSLAAVAAVLSLVVNRAGSIHAFVTGWMPALEAGAWYTWIWVGPATAGLALLGIVLFAVAVVACGVAALLVASVLAAPFLDALSQRVERIERGRVVEPGSGGLAALLREGWRSAGNELARVAFFAAVTLSLTAVGVVVPGAQLVAAPALVVFTALFLPLEYAGHVLDRRQIPFRARRRWVRARLPCVGGFGGAALLTFAVPGLNFLLLPVLVTAGTLLAVRYPPEGDTSS